MICMQKIGHAVEVAVDHGLHSNEVQGYRRARVVGSYLRRDLSSRRRSDAQRFYRVEYDDTGEIAEVREKRVRFVEEVPCSTT